MQTQGGNKMSRTIRRISRSVSRTVRRLGRETERVLRDTGHIAGDIVTGGSFTQKELAEKQAEADRKAAEEAAKLEAQQREQERLSKEAADKKIADEERYQKQLEEERQNAINGQESVDSTGVGLGDVETSFADTLKKKKTQRAQSSLKTALMS